MDCNTTTAKKLLKIIDGLCFYFFSIGSDQTHLDIKKRTDGYELQIESNYSPSYHEKILELKRFLSVPVKDEGIEEGFWQMAGVNCSMRDSELPLIGQMVELLELRVEADRVMVRVFKKPD